MIKIYKKVLNNKITRNIFVITSGTAFAQLLNIIVSPILSRIYTPDEFGIMSLFNTLIMTMSFFGSFNYEMAIPIVEGDDEAINVFSLSILLIVFSNVLIFFLILVFGERFLEISNASRIYNFRFLIPIGLFLLGLNNILSQWIFRKRAYSIVSKTKLSQSFSQNILSISLGVLKVGPIGLIIGKIIGQSGGMTTMFVFFLKDLRKNVKKINLANIIMAAKRFRHFPIYTTPRRYIGDLIISLPVLFITQLYGSTYVGLFSMANSILQLPMNLVGTSIGNVFYSESASLKYTNPSKVILLSNSLLKSLVLISIVPFFLVVLFGKELFGIFLGVEWREAGVYASILSFSIFSRFIFKPLSNIFDLYEKQRISLLINVFKMVLIALDLVIARYFKLGIHAFLYLYSLSMAFSYFLDYIIAKKIIKSESNKINE